MGRLAERFPDKLDKRIGQELNRFRAKSLTLCLIEHTEKMLGPRPNEICRSG